MIYTLQFAHHVTSNPADGSTSYFSRFQAVSSTFDSHKIAVPIAGTIVRIDAKARVEGVLGSGEPGTVSIRINDVDEVGEIPLTLSAAHNYGFEVVSRAVVAGDFIVAKFLAPTWATNPTGVRYHVSVVIEY